MTYFIVESSAAETGGYALSGAWPSPLSARVGDLPLQSVMRGLLPLFVLVTALLCPPAGADTVEEINRKSFKALDALRGHAGDAGKVLDVAAGVLVFPDMVKIGFGVGGQYGEGVLLVGGKPDSYYASAGASFGLQLGVQYKSEVIAFMTPAALRKFRDSRGWEVGVDSSVALLEVGAGGRIDTQNIKAPVVGFIFSNTGLMYNLTLEGARITRIAR